MKLKLSSACALLFACASAGNAEGQAAQPPSEACELHVYPAEGVHSVGEDFDAVHGVDQDLHHYYATAGRPLDWLTPNRQLELLSGMPLAQLTRIQSGPPALHPEPLSRRQALDSGSRTQAHGCVVEILVPQIMLERGGLANRSLRIFGVVRQYQDGAAVRTYSGYAAAPMSGFQLRSPADAASATQIVEAAYRAAVEAMLRNSNKTK